jgi:hypothetical protein
VARRITVRKIGRTVQARFRAPRPSDIPVIIINFNRLAYVKTLVERLVRDGFNEIYILDNASSYPPLLEWYKGCPAEVVHLDANLGKWALWQSGFYEGFRRRFYIYTDPDIVPDEACPPDYAERFLSCLARHPGLDKVGFGLRIDDLSDHYSKKTAVLEHEAKYWRKEIEPGVYSAPIDTTFALYRPGVQGLYELAAARLGAPYVARHLTWYEDSANLSEELLFYQQSVNDFNAGVEDRQKRTHWHR